MKRKPINYKLTEKDHAKIKDFLANQMPVYIIAKKIGCDRHTLADYIREHGELLDAQNDREEAFKDAVEYELRRKILEERNLNAMMFYADRKMRDRGYGEHIENEHTGGIESTVAFGEIPEEELPGETTTPPEPEPIPDSENANEEAK